MGETANRWPPSSIALVSGAVLAVAIVALAISGGSGPLTAPKAILLGAVEGVTEFLPISSTGHLLITERLLDLGSGKGKAAADTFAIAIQIGAILAVVALYWQRIVQLFAGLVGRDADGRTLLVRLCVAFVPAALVGVVFEDTIKSHLFGSWPVIAAWAVGGVFLLWWKPKHGTLAITDITARSALIIGCAQILALWPGVSRSLVTLVAALGVGCAIGSALEFSFLLGLATLSAASLPRSRQGRRDSRRRIRVADTVVGHSCRIRDGGDRRVLAGWLLAHAAARGVRLVSNRNCARRHDPARNQRHLNFGGRSDILAAARHPLPRRTQGRLCGGSRSGALGIF